MNRWIKLMSVAVIASVSACAWYFTTPLRGYIIAKGLNVGSPALPYLVYSKTTLEAINAEFEKAGARISLADTYQYAYGKSFADLPPSGDTGQAFMDMTTATTYLQNILQAKGVADAETYFLTSIDSARDFGFTLVAAVKRTGKKLTVYDKFGASRQNTLTCENPTFYQPFRYDCEGCLLDTVYEWAALPNDCFSQQGDQAIFLTLTANKLLQNQPKEDYWAAERKWLAGDYRSVVVAQDVLVCRELGIEEGYTTRRKVFIE
jgi:hypothetical protein